MTETTDEQRWNPDLGIDGSVAHPARVYDYWLGGKDNFAADRIAGDRRSEERRVGKECLE